tara:strand:+ start:2216 stop:2440 length:225 start_codon:yes stop_codon:yes gene_type:complete
MNWEIRLAIALMLVLVLLSLQACNQVPVIDKIEQQHEQKQTVEDSMLQTTPPNFQGIANALGCVFAPNTCNNSE